MVSPAHCLACVMHLAFFAFLFHFIFIIPTFFPLLQDFVQDTQTIQTQDKDQRNNVYYGSYTRQPLFEFPKLPTVNYSSLFPSQSQMSLLSSPIVSTLSDNHWTRPSALITPSLSFNSSFKQWFISISQEMRAGITDPVGGRMRSYGAAMGVRMKRGFRMTSRPDCTLTTYRKMTNTLQIKSGCWGRNWGCVLDAVMGNLGSSCQVVATHW